MKILYKSASDIRQFYRINAVNIFFRTRLKRVPSSEELKYFLNSLGAGKTFYELRAEYAPELMDINISSLRDFANESSIDIDIDIDENYRGSIEVAVQQDEYICGEVAKLPVTIFNESVREWRSNSENPDNLSYHIYSSDGELFVYDGMRTTLQSPVKSKSSSSQFINIATPPVPGEYKIEVTLVKENVNWFESVGFNHCTFAIRVASHTLSFLNNYNSVVVGSCKSSMNSSMANPIAMSPLEFYMSKKNI